MNPLFLEFSVVFLGILLLMVEAFLPQVSKKCLAVSAVLGLAIILGLTFLPLGSLAAGSSVANFYTTDALAMFFKRFMLIMTMVMILMAIDFIPVIERFIPGERAGAGVGEFFILPLFACAGLMWLVSSIDFIMLFVSLELMTVALYILIAYLRSNTASLEAGVKYLILSALATGFLVFGIAWITGVTGTTSIAHLGATIKTLPVSSQTPLLFGIAFVLVAFCFKIAAFPFQFWLPDVYQGAPTPVTTYLSVASKAAGFVILVRLLGQLNVIPAFHHKLLGVTTLLAIMTLLFGNLAALPQTNMKRLLSYSSIAHTGYLLMAVASMGALLAVPALAFYLAAYLAMTSLAFFILMLVAEASGGDDIYAFQGLHQRSPVLAGTMTLAMLSLAGLPLSAGFFGKFFIFQVTLQQGHYGLVVIGSIAVVAGFYYYLKVVRAMYWQQPVAEAKPITISGTAKLLLGSLSAAILIFGVYPGPLLKALH